MVGLDWIRFVAGAILLVLSLVIYIIEIIGIFRFRYVLNRMHAAAMGDSLGIFLAMMGLIMMNGLQASSWKMLLVVIFFWLASPVAAHLISCMEINTNEDKEKHYDELDLTEEKEETDGSI